MKSRWAAPLFMLPALAAVGVLILWPLVQTVLYSMTNFNPAVAETVSTGLSVERSPAGELTLVIAEGSAAEEAGLTSDTVFEGLLLPAVPPPRAQRERLERFRGDPARRLNSLRNRLRDAEERARALPERERRLTLYVAEEGGGSREVVVPFEAVPMRGVPGPALGVTAVEVSNEWQLLVEPGSVAARAGLTRESVVTAINGESLESLEEFNARLDAALKTTQREGGEIVLELRTRERPDLPAREVRLPGQRGAFTIDPPPALTRSELSFVGLWNYWRILVPSETSNEARDFYRYLGHTVIWTVTNVTLHFILGLGLAILLNRQIRGRVIYRILLLLPWVVPVFVSAFAWRFLFNQQGLINQVLSGVGMEPIPWLSSTTWTMVAVIVTNVWLGVPFMMIVLLGGLQSIPDEMYEAAHVDGATKWQQFWSVTLPLLKPVAVTATLLGVIWTFNMFNVIYLVQGREGRQVEILATLAFRRFYVNQEYGLAAAYGVIILIMLLVFAWLYIRALKGTERICQ